jgi:Amidohydrolase
MSVAELVELREFINAVPVIDVLSAMPLLPQNHAHNLIVSTGEDEDLECIVSEASGPALKHAPSSLAHIQAVTQLAELYNCEPSWEAIKRHRIQAGFDKITEKCFEASGIQCILMDDLFSSADKVAIPFSWHDRLTKSRTRRIVRVETLAEQVAKDMTIADPRVFIQSYLKLLVDAARDPDIVGFKSVICYRTGLDIEVTLRSRLDSRADAFVEYFTNGKQTGNWRLNSKPLNDMVTNIAVQISGEYNKPIQFHTGLGDNDIRLVKANPAYMQTLIEAYPKAKFVLLHSSYPYTREAGYLTTVYDNVYLDCIPLYCAVNMQSAKPSLCYPHVFVGQIPLICSWTAIDAETSPRTISNEQDPFCKSPWFTSDF